MNLSVDMIVEIAWTIKKIANVIVTVVVGIFTYLALANLMSVVKKSKTESV